MIQKNNLTALQLKKLKLSAEILKATAHLYDESKNLLPLWGAGVITHGIPKINACVIGITHEAKNVTKKEQTKDHLYRVTETANVIIIEINNKTLTSVEAIENRLLERSALMITTRQENNTKLKDALKKCTDKDNWKTLYFQADIKYELHNKTE